MFAHATTLHPPASIKIIIATGVHAFIVNGTGISRTGTSLALDNTGCGNSVMQSLEVRVNFCQALFKVFFLLKDLVADRQACLSGNEVPCGVPLASSASANCR